MSETTSKTRILAEIIVFAALSAMLYAVRPFSLPYGGSITLGSLVPIFWLALRRGVKVGIFAGAIFGAIALFIDVLLLPYSPITNPVQVLVEYPMSFGMLGLAGLFRKLPVISSIYLQIDEMKTKSQSKIDNLTELRKKIGILENELMSIRALAGVGIGLTVRFFIHFLAGIFFWWWSVPPDWDVVAWSAVYNGSFLTGEFIISAFLIYLLVRKGTVKMYM